MNGTKAFLELLRGAGVRYLFGNPGHTELPMLDVLAGMPEMDYILGLNEAVAMAMADGYAMASGRLGVFCSHITPGFGNALGMLYDASKTGAPLLVTAGQQDSRFSLSEPALWGDLVGLARPLTKWAYQVEQIGDLPRAMRRAIKVATTPPTGPVFLSLPSDVLREEAEFDLTPPTPVGSRVRGDRDIVLRVCNLLLGSQAPVLVAGDAVGKSGAEDELLRLAELLGCPVYSEPSSNTFNFQADHPLYQGTLARTQKGVREVLEQFDLLFAVGADLITMATYAKLEPIPDKLRLIQLHSDAWQLGKNYPTEALILGDPKATLAEMVEEIRRLSDRSDQWISERKAYFAQRRSEALAAMDRQVTEEAGRTPMAGSVLMKTLIEHAPENGIIVDESQTAGMTLRTCLLRRPLAYYGLKGGGLGWGVPASVGVQFAHPDRPVLALLGDGSAMYTIQGLWSAAHYRRKVVFIICNNRQYRIVKHRLHLYGGQAAKHRKYLGVDLSDPAIDFVSLGQSMGVWSTRIERPDQVADGLREALKREGPALLDIAVEGSYPETQSAS
ncbi:MAG TPA: thiamine pyrophosphate-binding protein [Nitrospiria bacterium]|nr:thiamine pyrophosphate-binding protein [Nitrospiria bacterium]